MANKRKLIFEVKEGHTECNLDCPFYLEDYEGDCGDVKGMFFDCAKLNMLTLKLIKNEENTEV